eukprot:461330_1
MATLFLFSSLPFSEWSDEETIDEKKSYNSNTIALNRIQLKKNNVSENGDKIAIGFVRSIIGRNRMLEISIIDFISFYAFFISNPDHPFTLKIPIELKQIYETNRKSVQDQGLFLSNMKKYYSVNDICRDFTSNYIDPFHPTRPKVDTKKLPFSNQIKNLFDEFLTQLLYNVEHMRLTQIKTNKYLKSKRFCELFGGQHLLRLLVRFQDLVPVKRFSDHAKLEFKENMKEFTEFMCDNKWKYLDGKYTKDWNESLKFQLRNESNQVRNCELKPKLIDCTGWMHCILRQLLIGTKFNNIDIGIVEVNRIIGEASLLWRRGKYHYGFDIKVECVWQGIHKNEECIGLLDLQIDSDDDDDEWVFDYKVNTKNDVANDALNLVRKNTESIIDVINVFIEKLKTRKS